MCASSHIIKSKLFAQHGYELIYCSKILFESDAHCFYGAAIHAHQGVELLLKSWLVWIHDDFEKIHRLPDLANKITNHHLDEKLLIKVDTFYIHRYPLIISKDRSSIAKKLIQIKDMAFGVHNRITEPEEIGSDDWDKVGKLTRQIYISLPGELRDVHTPYFERFFSLEELEKSQ